VTSDREVTGSASSLDQRKSIDGDRDHSRASSPGARACDEWPNGDVATDWTGGDYNPTSAVRIGVV